MFVKKSSWRRKICGELLEARVARPHCTHSWLKLTSRAFYPSCTLLSSPQFSPVGDVMAALRELQLALPAPRCGGELHAFF